MTTGETQTEQARLREEIELLRDQVKSDRILLPGRNVKLLFLQQPCEHYPGRIWTQGISDFALLEQDGIAPFWSEPLGEYIGQSRCRTEDGEDWACYGMFLNVIEQRKENLFQHANAIGQLLLADAAIPGFEFFKELFEFCRLNKRLTWESNEQPGHPETRRRLAWLYDVYEAIGLFLIAQMKSPEQPTEAVADRSGKRSQKKAGRKPAEADKITEACNVWIDYEREGKGPEDFCVWRNGDKKVGRITPKWLNAKLTWIRKLIKEDRIPAEFKNKLKPLRPVKSIPKKKVKNSRHSI